MSETQTQLSEFMPYRMAITSNAVSGLISGEYRSDFGLKIPEWRIMCVLGDAGPQTQRNLVQATLMDKVAVNRACKVLEMRSLVRRSPNEADGRSHHLELTEEGRAMHTRIWPHAVEIYDKIFAALSPREVEKLRQILGKLLDSVKAIEATEK